MPLSLQWLHIYSPSFHYSITHFLWLWSLLHVVNMGTEFGLVLKATYLYYFLWEIHD
jgi:hypothetical protein